MSGDDDDEDDGDGEGSMVSGERRAEDTVSINSDSDDEGEDESSQESQTQHKTNDIIVLDTDNQPGSQNGNFISPEVHEIESDNDDCVIATEDKKEEKSKDVVPLRRSSRAIKRKRYTDDIENGNQSDIEEIEFQDPLHRRGKPIVINDTKALVEMAAKQMKMGNHQKKETTVVIIDTNSVTGKGTSLLQNKAPVSSSNSALNAQNLYQSIVARGTTVTPVSSKSSTATQVSQNAQPAILPSLTDDMFVVEAPSFIVPYVYEKPSIKPFREFVFKLGKELEEQRLKDGGDNQPDKEQKNQDKENEVDDEASGDESKSQNTEDSEGTESKPKNSNRKGENNFVTNIY